MPSELLPAPGAALLKHLHHFQTQVTVTATSTFIDSKKHLLILDALRGIAAIVVILMHTFELYCEGDYHKMIINHGYLAVDFFFMLSGYVMAHAYDDRWDKMTVGDFIKRRLIRLHPLMYDSGGYIFLLAGFTCFRQSSGYPSLATHHGDADWLHPDPDSYLNGHQRME